MALVHRINSNFGFVLNTLYCKCMINIKRPITEHNITRYFHKAGANKLENYESFEQMLKFREDQAKRCILIKMQNIKCINELEKFCQYYASVVNVFPYSTMKENIFVLMELRSSQDVVNLRNIALFKTEDGHIQSVTPFFLFNTKNRLHTNKSNKHITVYSDFQAPSPNEIKRFLGLQVSNQIICLYNVLKITDLNIRLRFYTANQISYYLSRLFANIHVVPFGSSVNGFGQIGCDLDLLCKTVTDVNKKHINCWKKFFFFSQYIPLAERNEQKEFLEVVGTIMEMCIPGIVDVKKILPARVPIIKFCNLNTNMKCDLSSTNTIALQMSELLYLYGQLDLRVRPLVCIIRKWARVMDLTKEYAGQWITNFSLTLLIIFYLQTKDILPSVNTIKSLIKLSKGKNNAIDLKLNWFVNWKKSIKCPNDENLQDLLFNFFQYYSVFDFKTQAICIKDGTFKPKNDFSPLYIYNPFDTTLNVSKNVTLNELMRLVDCFQKGFNIMLDADERNIIRKLINLEPKTNNEFNSQKTQIKLKEKLLPTVTDINGLEKIQRNIIK